MGHTFISGTSRRFSVLALLSLLSSCAVNLPQHSADISLPEHWRHRYSESGAQDAPFKLKAWWTRFEEPELDRLVERVSDSNLAIREIAARVAAAQALQVAAREEFRPSVRLATAPASTPDSRASYLQSGIEATWPLGLFGRADAVTEASAADSELVRSQGDFLRTRIIADTVRAYIEYRTASADAANLDRQIAAQAERSELMRERVRLHLSGLADLALEEGRLEDLRSRLLAIARTATEARERLGLLLATADAFPEPVQLSDLRLTSIPPLPSVPADLLRDRADVRHAEQEALKSAAELRVAEADLYPQLTLVGSLTVSLPIAGTSAHSAGALAAIAPAIDIPLFDWGRRRAIVTAQDRNLEAALTAYRERVLTAAHEVEVAIATLDSVNEDSVLRGNALRRAEQMEGRTAIAVRLGRASHLDALSSTLVRLEAQASVTAAEHSRALAYIALCEALGGADPRSDI